MKSNRNPFILLSVLAAITLVVFAGCAVGGGAKVTRTIAVEGNKTNTVEVAQTHPFIAFGDAVQKVSSMKAGNTKSGNAINVSGIDQEVTSSNIVNGAASAFGTAAKAFFAP